MPRRERSSGSNARPSPPSDGKYRKRSSSPGPSNSCAVRSKPAEPRRERRPRALESRMTADTRSSASARTRWRGERYAERRLTEPARVDKRTGMHALAIEVDPAAYRAVKTEAARRRITIPRQIGEILRSSAFVERTSSDAAPRWTRTGEGRRANQHTRVGVDDQTWENAHVDAARAGYSVSRWIGLVVERWAIAQLGGRGGG